MALVDVPGNGKSDPGAVEIILRAARPGPFTAARAGRLTDQIRPHPATLALSIEDGSPAGLDGAAGERAHQYRSDTVVTGGIRVLRPEERTGAELLTVTADRVHPGVVVITVHGEVDLLTSPLLLDALLVHLPRPGAQLIIDLTAVGFFGAAGLTVLSTIRHQTLAAGIGLRLVAHTRPVLLPLTITGMHTLFDLHPDLAHALRASTGGLSSALEQRSRSGG